MTDHQDTEEELKEIIESLTGIDIDEMLESLLGAACVIGHSVIPEPQKHPKRGSTDYLERFHYVSREADVDMARSALNYWRDIYGWRGPIDYLFHLCELLQATVMEDETDLLGVINLRKFIVFDPDPAHGLRMAADYSQGVSEEERAEKFSEVYHLGQEVMRGNVPWYNAVYRCCKRLSQLQQQAKREFTFNQMGNVSIAAPYVHEERHAAWAELATAPEARTNPLRVQRAILPLHLLYTKMTRTG